MKLSVLITAYKEAATVGHAIEAFVEQLPDDAEILVICPDPETTAVVDEYARRHACIRHIADPQRGKPTALNLGLQAAVGDIIVFSDGDVVIAAEALKALLAPLKDPHCGAVTGRPLSRSAADTLLGYWSHLLTDSAHTLRQKNERERKFLLCSGYLFAMRRGLISVVPEDALAEDAVISHRIAAQNYRIRYAADAQVWVKYPTTYQDWLRQKVRSAGGYAQDYIRNSPFRMRSAKLEILKGTQLALGYARNLRELFWTGLLFLARLHLWILVYINVRVRKRTLSSLWQRVETTK